MPDRLAGATGDELVLDGVRWPGTSLAPLIRRSEILVSAWCALRPAPREVHPGDEPAAAHYLEAWRLLVDGASHVFAHANHWRVSPTPFSPEQLRTGRTRHDLRHVGARSWPEALGAPLDAVAYFRGPGGRPTALVVHSTADIQLAIAGLRLVRLPACWWSPRALRAYVITRAAP